MGNKALVVGLGFAGSVVARQLAEAGFSVLALERRSHIAGNMHESVRPNGVRVHSYGPHIFHTNSLEVYKYLSRFSDFYPYTHRVLGLIKGQLVPIAFNFRSMEILFTQEEVDRLKVVLFEAFGDRERVLISELTAHENPEISAFGQFVFENVFANYTAKQWGVPVSEVAASVINRVPVVLGYDDRYFSDAIQMMPKDGFTSLFERLLDHPSIQIQVQTDAANHLQFDPVTHTAHLHDVSFHGVSFHGDPVPGHFTPIDQANGNVVMNDAIRTDLFTGPICFSGPIDELFDGQLGPLPYRSLDMHFEDLHMDYYQPAAVVNYPNDEEFTRITEFKRLTQQYLPGHTTIVKEYPLPYTSGQNRSPFYPIAGPDNTERYHAYLDMARPYRNLYLCGRLAEYRYYNMDSVIERALQTAEQIISDYGTQE
jgi:UDP-galactopyranose mutase